MVKRIIPPKPEPIKEVRIFVDKRELMDVYENLVFYQSFYDKFEDFQIIDKTLLSADLMFGDIIGAERKSISDLIASIRNGRIFYQAHKIAINFKYGYILISGNPSDIVDESARRSVMTTLADVEMRYNMHCRFCGDEEMLAYYFLNLCYKLKKDVKPKFVMRKPEISNVDEKVLVMTGISGIGRKLAKSLFERFKSIKGIFEAPLDEIKKIPRFGEKTAKHLKEIYIDETPIYELGNAGTSVVKFK